MTGHLTDAELREFAAGRLAPTDLLRADDHLSRCDQCRTRASAVNDAATRADDFREQLGAPSVHLSDEDLQQFVSMRSAADARTEIEEHLRRCRICAAQVDDLRAWAGPATSRRPAWLAIAAALVVGVVVPSAIWYARTGRPTGSSSLAGLETLAAPEHARIQAALASGAGQLPPFMSDIAARRETLMGPRSAERGESFELMTPMQTAVLSDRPQFEWRPSAGAEGYVVTVADEGSRVVARSPLLATTTWIPSAPLRRGGTYTWQVAARRGRDTITVPAPPAPPARFHVVDAHTTDVVRRVEREHPDSHLLIGLLDMEAGLRAEAAAQFQQVSARDPHADVARRSLERLQALEGRPGS